MDNTIDYTQRLPIEILEHIFSYLSIPDIKAASLTCQRWLSGTFSPEITSRINLNFSSHKYSLAETMNYFKNESYRRKFTSVIFWGIYVEDSLEDDEEFWINLGKTVTELIFVSCSISEQKLCKILEKFQKLTILNIRLKKDLNCNNILTQFVEKLKILSLKRAIPFDTITYNNISNKRSTIECLTCQIACGYSKSIQITIDVFKKMCYSLKTLALHLPDTTKPEEKQQLKSLKNYFNKPNTKCVFKFKTLTETVSSIVRFTFPTEVDNHYFKIICNSMSNLKYLVIDESIYINNKGILELSLLKKLEILIIDGCQYISNEGIINGIAKTRNETLKQICLQGHFSDDALIKIAENMPNLQCLEISSILFLSNRCPRSIFQHLKDLRILRLYSLHSEEQHDRFFPDEIIQTLTPSRSIEFTISCNKKLREVCLHGFEFIPGASLEDIAQLRELEILKLHSFNKLSKIGVKNLVKNCHHLKCIEFIHCESLSSTLIYFLSSIKTLKSLKIHQNNKIDDECVKAIKAANRFLNFEFLQMQKPTIEIEDFE